MMAHYHFFTKPEVRSVPAMAHFRALPEVRSVTRVPHFHSHIHPEVRVVSEIMQAPYAPCISGCTSPRTFFRIAS